MNQQQRDQNKNTEAYKDYFRCGDRLSKTDKISKVLGSKFKENKTSNQNSENLRPRLDHTRLVGIRNLFDNERMQGDIL